MTILIVDDTDEKITQIEKVILEMFSDSEIIIHKASNNANAAQVLLSLKQIDLMILDLNLPIRNGEAPKRNAGKLLLKEIIRRQELTKPNSIIGLTAHEDIKAIFDENFNKEGWVIAHYNPKYTNWEETIKNKILYLKDKGKSESDKLDGLLPIIIILTAIKPEYLAVRAHLHDVKDSDINDTSYETGVFKIEERKIATIVIRECGAKNTNASQETERAIQYFKPQAIFFVGIAGSRKPTDFGIGDVIFPEKVYSYEGGKSEKESFLSRPDNALMSYTLMEKAKKERNKEDWKSLIKGTWEQKPKADLGIIASGEQVVEHYDSSIGTILTKHYNDTSAVEMEGFGFGKAANRQGRETNNILVGVVRGISDVLGRSSKNEKEESEDRRPAYAKELASDTAAAFAFWLIFKTYES